MAETPTVSRMTVVQRPIGKVIPYARNPRKITQTAVDKVASSIQEFGWRQPIVVDDDGVVVVGHTRLKAAQKLGLKKVPVHVASGLTEAQLRAYRLADNRVGEESSWDEEMLSIELSDLAGVDAKVTGFSKDELDKFMAGRGAGLTDPDDAPEAPEVPVARTGDLWHLGEHRILCGDSTDAKGVNRLLGQDVPHLMVTDPPYGVRYDPKWRKQAGLVGDGAAEGVVTNDHRADWREAWELFPGRVCYVWHAGVQAASVADSLAAVKIGVRSQIVWVKTRPVISRGHYHHQHEPCLYGVRDDAPDDDWRFVPEHEVATYAVKEGRTAEWQGSRKQSTVWMIEHLKSGTGHGTQKPVECMRRPIVNNSSPGQAVYDPFLGSGTTLIASEMEGRCCLGLEIDPAYCDVIIKRWQDFTGKQAQLDGDRTFSAVASSRAAEEEDNGKGETA